jgi:predicted phage-related endonuclease
LTERPEAVEAKYVGPQSTADWGAEGTDEVPDHVIIQVQHQMYVGDLDRVWVAAALAGYRLEWRMYCVLRSDPLIRVLVERELAFWWDHVAKGMPPNNEPPPIEVLKALRREPDKVIDLPEHVGCLWDYRLAAAEKRKEEEREYETATAALLAQLGDAEAGRLADGRLLTYLSQRASPRVDVKRLQREKPDVWKEYVQETTCRVLRMREPKKKGGNHGDG